jgi:hypothetical protein
VVKTVSVRQVVELIETSGFSRNVPTHLLSFTQRKQRRNAKENLILSRVPLSLTPSAVVGLAEMSTEQRLLHRSDRVPRKDVAAARPNVINYSAFTCIYCLVSLEAE